MHYVIVLRVAGFSGKSTLERHRLGLGAIAHLLAGDGAPVQAVDKFHTRVP